MSMYLSSISLAVPEADPADYTQIELIMREGILHSELDGCPPSFSAKRLVLLMTFCSRCGHNQQDATGCQGSGRTEWGLTLLRTMSAS